MSRGRDQLIAALVSILGNKEDKAEYISGALGTYDSVGAQVIAVPTRTDYVYVTVRGQTSEVVEAFNDKVYLQFGLPVILTKDPLQPRSYKILSRDTGKYQEWGSAGLVAHGDQHSFSGKTSAGVDVVYTYKRQMAQPLLCHPQSTPDMTVYVESDFYYWNGSYVRFAGASSASLTPYLPPSGSLRFVLMYMDGASNTVQILQGSDFLQDTVLFPPSGGVVAQIPSLNPSIGIPLTAILLDSAMTSIGWDSLYGMRPMLSTPAGSLPLPHALDPAQGFHTGSLPASDVSLVNSGSWFTGANAEAALQELGPVIYRRQGHIVSDGTGTFPQRDVLEFAANLNVVDIPDQNKTRVSGTVGVTASITTADLVGKTITVVDGIIVGYG